MKLYQDNQSPLLSYLVITRISITNTSNCNIITYHYSYYPFSPLFSVAFSRVAVKDIFIRK